MEYRALPRGGERISALGIGMGGIHEADPAEIEQVVAAALDAGINYFDMCGGGAAVYAPFGRAIAHRREDVLFQLHFGAVYNDAGDYGWSREPEQIRRTFQWEMETMGIDTVDFGFLHCIDEQADWDALQQNGVLAYVQSLKDQGVVRHIGFSSHTPSVANQVLDTGLADMFMFSVNPAYDLEKGDDELGIGSVAERAALLRRCEALGVGVSVMKPFHGGRLLDEKTSPFGRALTRAQCLQYALDRPGVLTVLPGVRGMDDLRDVLAFLDTPPAEKDYSFISAFAPEQARGTCVYCNHCKPCPAGIDIGLVNKYYDLAMAGDNMAAGHYHKLAVQADACLHCGHCDRRCPFGVHQSARMTEIAAWGSAAG